MKAGEAKSFRSSKYQPETGQFKPANSTYVIRVISITPDEMQLRRDFLGTFLQFRDHKDGGGNPVSGQSPTNRNQRMEIGNGWLRDLHDQLDVNWIREPRMQR